MNLFRKFKTYSEIAPDFLSDVKKTLEPRSYQGYLGKSNVFAEWLESKGLAETPLKKITDTDMEAFFNYLTEERESAAKTMGLDQPTCKKYKDTLTKVWEYAKKRGEVDDMPFGLVTLPRKGDDMSSDVILPEHLVMLLQAFRKRDTQLYLAASTEYYCFLRPGTELRLLKVGDVNIENGTMQVITDHAKNGHKRIVTIPSQLADIFIEQKIKDYPPDFYVFGNRHVPGLKPCSVNMFRWRFNKFRDEFKMSKKYKFYSLKHTGASNLHSSNMVSLHEIMIQLGHSRLSATEKYIKHHAGFINTKIRDSFPNPFANLPSAES